MLAMYGGAVPGGSGPAGRPPAIQVQVPPFTPLSPLLRLKCRRKAKRILQLLRSEAGGQEGGSFERKEGGGGGQVLLGGFRALCLCGVVVCSITHHNRDLPVAASPLQWTMAWGHLSVAAGDFQTLARPSKALPIRTRLLAGGPMPEFHPHQPPRPHSTNYFLPLDPIPTPPTRLPAGEFPAPDRRPPARRR